MGITAGNVLTGACVLKLDNPQDSLTDVGLTSEDGITFSEDKTWTEVQGDQSLVRVKKRLSLVIRTITATLLEVTEDWLQIVGGYVIDTKKVKYSHKPTELDCEITGPAADVGGVAQEFTYTTTVISVELGDVVRTKTGEVGLPITLEELGNPTDNTFGDYSEGAA